MSFSKQRTKNKLEGAYYRLAAVTFYLRILNESEMEHSRHFADSFVKPLRAIDDHLGTAMCILRGRMDTWDKFNVTLPSGTRANYPRPPHLFQEPEYSASRLGRAERDWIWLTFSVKTTRDAARQLEELFNIDSLRK